MIWKIEFDSDVEKDLRKLGAVACKRIFKYLRENIASSHVQKSHGKPLSGNLSGLWRYRVGDYRIISKIEEDVFTILIIKVGHRKDIYD